jgi:hypothetical protein
MKEGAVEPFILLAIWVFGIYFIRIHMELRAFKKEFNQHRDIYVPSYEELMKMNHWSMQLARFIIKEINKAKKSNISRKMYPSFQNKNDVAVLALASNSDKSKSGYSEYEEYENRND